MPLAFGLDMKGRFSSVSMLRRPVTILSVLYPSLLHGLTAPVATSGIKKTTMWFTPKINTYNGEIIVLFTAK